MPANLRDYIKSIFSEELTAIEVEASLLHEIGHIYLKHINMPSMSQQTRFQNEFYSDIFAYINDRGRHGFTRKFKRRILKQFLYPPVIAPQQTTHPSHEDRLAKAHNYELLVNNGRLFGITR